MGRVVSGCPRADRILKKALLFWINFILSASPLCPQSVNLPLDHWAYDYLERMETKGVLHRLRDGSRPFTRAKVAEYAQEMDAYAKKHPEKLSKIEKELLERLKGELWDELETKEVAVQKDQREPHFYSWRGSSGTVHLDLLSGGNGILRDTHAEKTEREIYSPYYGGILRGTVWGIGIYSDNRIFTEWGSRSYVQNYKASQGYPQNVERDSSRATWDTSDSYFCLQWKGFFLQAGRDNLCWGPTFFGGLSLSGWTPSFDLVKVATCIGASTVTWIHGALRSDFVHKWISAHRLELSVSREVDLGVSETVIYGNRGIEMAYVNPLIPYLIAEHTLGDKDNVTLGLDVDIHTIRNLKLYGELFIDDLFAPWEIFRDYWGNKLAFTLGGYWVDPLGLKDTGLRWEYTRIDPYVYTHRDSVNVYENYNIGLGHFLQPNSDAWIFRGEHRFSMSFLSSLEFRALRHGTGDRQSPHREEEGDRKRFLEGVVEQEKRLSGSMEWEIFRDCRAGAEVARLWNKNRNHKENDNRTWNEIVFMLRMNW